MSTTEFFGARILSRAIGFEEKEGRVTRRGGGGAREKAKGPPTLTMRSRRGGGGSSAASAAAASSGETFSGRSQKVCICF